MAKAPVAAMVALGNPIVVAQDIVVCDACGTEYDAVTDGFRAYAHADGRGEITLFGQNQENLTQIVGSCSLPWRGDDTQPCFGDIRIDLTERGMWVAATPQSINLLAHGDVIERA